jgi:hypothetical protein
MVETNSAITKPLGASTSDLHDKSMSVTFDITLVKAVDFSFENGTKYKLPDGLGDGPHSEAKKPKKMNSVININNGASIEYYSRSPAKMSSSKLKAVWKPPVGRNGTS